MIFHPGMTRENCDRLRPFDEHRLLDLLLTLPQALMRRARIPGRKRREAAWDAGIATRAIEIFLLRGRRDWATSAKLEPRQHVLIDPARPDRVQLVIDEDETKNGLVARHGTAARERPPAAPTSHASYRHLRRLGALRIFPRPKRR